MDKALKDLDVYISDGNYSAKYPRSEEFVEEGIPFIRANNLYDGNIVDEDMYFITQEKHSVLLKGHVKSGDVLITTRGNIGQVAIVPDRHEDSNINAQIVLLRTKQECLFNRYLLWALQSQAAKEQYLALQTGTALKQLPVGKLEQLRIRVTDIEEQHKIARKLDQVHRLIKARQEELALLDNLIKARFVEMFGEPIDNPMNWPVKRLKELSSLITNGNTPKGGSENYIDQGIVFLRSQNVWRNRIDLSDVAYIDEDTHAKLKKSSVHHNDILITKTGRINTENSSLGRAALYTGEDNSANINGHVYLIRLKNGIDPRFVVTILTGEAYRKYIRKVCVGGIDKRQINLDQVEDFPIILPPLEQQIQFSEFVEQIDKSKSVVQRSLDKTKLLFDCLMQQYFG